MSRFLVGAAVWFGIIWVAKKLGYGDQGVIASPVVVLLLQTILQAKTDQAPRPRVLPRLDEGLTAGLLAGVMVSATLIRGYSRLAKPGSLPMMRLTVEVASNFVPSVALLAIVIAITDAWASSVITKRTLIANEVVLLAAAATAVGGATGAVIGWYFSRYANQRPFAPPELLLASCVPAGIVVGLALAVRRGRRLDRPLMNALVVVFLIAVVLTAMAIAVADTMDLGRVLRSFPYPAEGGALYGAVTGLAVGITAGATMFIMRIWPAKANTP